MRPFRFGAQVPRALQGAAVAILAADDAGFRLTADEEGELVNALNAIRSGDYVDGRQLLDDLRKH